MKTRLLLVALLMGVVLTSSTAAHAADDRPLAGQYTVSGDDGRGLGKYTGTLEITADGESYIVRWTIGPERYVGIGVRDGASFAVAIRLETDPKYSAVAVYQIAADGRMSGRWTANNVRGKVGTETLTPVR